MEPFELLVRGQRLRGECWGPAGARARVFVHGFGSERSGIKARAFRDATLQVGERFAAGDLRGHGQSEGRIADMVLTDYVADASALLARFATPAQPAVVIGSSLGGLASLWAAAQAPELVAALILIAPALGWIPRLARLPREADRIVVKNQWVDHRVPVAALEDCSHWPEAELPRRVQARILIFHGTMDAQVPFDESVALAERMPGQCRLRRFEGGDHRLLDVLPVMLRETEDFVRTAASRGSSSATVAPP